MIDLGITKLALIGVVALVVIGPEKLPKVARLAGSLFGRAQRYINDVKSEVSREIELDELREIQQEITDAAKDVEHSISRNLAETERELKSGWGDPKSDATPSFSYPTSDHLALKAKDFRRKKLTRTSAIPLWYKQRNGGKTHIISAAARVARYRRGRKVFPSFF